MPRIVLSDSKRFNSPEIKNSGLETDRICKYDLLLSMVQPAVLSQGEQDSHVLDKLGAAQSVPRQKEVFNLAQVSYN